ncbi:MAG: hypothetical protein Q4B22_07390 [Eubacteriales bacterium]|nr:hypothetical protein [Eubacteriales bacterium]
MSKGWIIFIIVLAVLAIAAVVLYFLGKRAEKKQAEQQEQIDAAKQQVNMLVIDKKIVKMKDAGFPDIVMQNTPRMMKGRKVPVVKGKVGPRIMTFICDKPVYEIIPVKKEVKATISGLYITDVKGIRGSLGTAKSKKKESKLDALLKKGRGEA